jgi:oligopeptide/dipeptide ABC transporter ATP-binding protein
MALLSVRDLDISSSGLPLVSEVSFDVHAGERVGLIGESGSGKSLTALAVMGLLPAGLTATGRVELAGEDLLSTSERRRCALRGDRIAMIFQEPMTALNPTQRIGRQVGETLRIHRGVGRREAGRAAVDLLARVELPDPVRYADLYPHELSGGQRQRVMMAIAISCDPEVILADEPTTALDVTVQRKVLDLLDRLVAEEGCALMMTHDLAVVSELCDRVLTMYGGRVVESGTTDELLDRPRHPYTAALLATSQAISVDGAEPGVALPSIAGSVPAAGRFPRGCPFRDRCPRQVEACVEVPATTSEGLHAVACWNPVPVPVGRPASVAGRERP